MKTNNLNIEMMVPSQLNKDIIFNESMLKLDCFSNLGVTGFIDSLSEDIDVNEKYIIKYGEHKNKICYRSSEFKPISFLEPKKGMIIYIPDQAFFCFDGFNWKECSDNQIPSNFSGINEHYSIKNKINYLYLNNNSAFEISKIDHSEISIFIKQSADGVYQVVWPTNILWENKSIHIMTAEKNSIDLIKLYYLPETEHWLGKIIAQNFNY
ncbi:MAG: hypothetical protein EKK61_03395 [Rickettsiales bacterium]|nr:MAG: hypothetical protein EKK61_03395 [Rickettsiales bacterium]